jgi:ATP-binding protein involved in chromosome partitioning
MVMGTVQQLLKDVDWGNLDLLIIDMPPGTGDAHLTISQQVNLSGAIIVSTPQDIALIDARKGLNMFKKMGVPVLGIIENMSFFCCPACGTNTPIFSTNGAAQEAEKLEVPFLGKIPIELAIRESADEGLPVMLKDHHPHIQNIYGEMSRKIWKQLEA